jgi:polyhydroxyalkanoate synthesis regulator phasin
MSRVKLTPENVNDVLEQYILEIMQGTMSTEESSEVVNEILSSPEIIKSTGVTKEEIENLIKALGMGDILEDSTVKEGMSPSPEYSECQQDHSDYEGHDETTETLETLNRLDGLTLADKMEVVLHDTLNSIILGDLSIESGKELKEIAQAVAISRVDNA